MLYFFAEHFIVEREQAARQQRDAIAAERGRILQDMHDGMGAQLITALRLARRGDVPREQLIGSIEESLQDMRLIVDSLDLTEHDLLPLLGNLRFRLEPRLAALGIRLEWQVTPLPELPYLTPASALAVLRIAQEAINNAVQHANPEYIRISANAEADGIVIGIADNGPGFTPAMTSPSSRGLSGMYMRAERLGARLRLESDASGTRVTLLLPIAPPKAARIP
jgi:signal transduction histidine kinase